eukprot:gb/GECH01007176.1/.p1 GENE.gb/GECH01007176.1/~~gb/GECH01007176.1/.p1  ORF type:complete len:367 (+),score=37.66 gb/GECH01007176.1/:1-1101(+)
MSLCIPQPGDDHSLHYHGVIPHHNEEYNFHISFPKDSSQISLICCTELEQLIIGRKNQIIKQLQYTASLNRSPRAVCNRALDILSRAVEEEAVTDQQDVSTSYYRNIMQEMDLVGWQRLVSLSADLTSIDIRIIDEARRDYILNISVTGEYPDQPPICRASIPSPVALRWHPSCTLLDAVRQYEEEIQRLQDAWAVLDDIDRCTWVLEPEHPTPAQMMRRIGLGNHASLQIDIDPNAPRRLPECRFLGADSIVLPLRENLNRNVRKWNLNLTLRENLEAVLEMKFPEPKEVLAEDFSVECGICYAYRLDDAVADKVCDNPQCCQPFHRQCLHDWLRAIPSTRQSFDTLFGQCPYCSSPITVKMFTK